MIKKILFKKGDIEVVSLAAIALSLVNVGSSDAEVPSTILQKLLELTPIELASPYSR